MSETDFIRSSIKPKLYGEIQGLVYHVKLFVDNENLAVNFGSPLDNLNVWRNYGQEILERLDKITSRHSIHRFRVTLLKSRP